MRLEDVLPALRRGEAIQRSGQPVPWAYLTRSPNGAYHWYGYGDDPTHAVPMSMDFVALDADDWVIVDPELCAALRPAATFNCGRRGPIGSSKLHDHWQDRRGKQACSYCGSLHPDVLMAHLEAGEVELTPTDKNYKVYVDGAGFSGAKFYFQHLSEEQRERFVQLFNDRRLKFIGGSFYVWPFFMAPLG